MGKAWRTGAGAPSLFLSAILVVRGILGEESTLNQQGNLWSSQDPCVNTEEAASPDYLWPSAAPYATVIGSQSITLTWKPLNQSDVLYIPQWMDLRQPRSWRQDKNVSEPPFTVDHLLPFSSYKFRVWAVMSQQCICSPESPWHRTEAFGIPTSPPVIESVESMTGESVEVSWSEPEYPRGPIVGYNLNLTDQTDVTSITTGGNVFFTTFYPTFPNTTYRISIAAVNRDGMGPVAEVNMTTPARKVQDGTRWIVVSRLNSLRKKEESADFFTSADCLPDRLIAEDINSVAVDHSTNQVYFSEGSRIWVKGAGNLTDHSDLQLFHSVEQEVTALSVDWLHRKLYYVSNGEVYCCKLQRCFTAVAVNISISGSPTKITADPYNGWLFLLMNDGIYRMPLPNVSGLRHNVTQVVRANSVKDFVVSFPNKKLVFLHEKNETLSAVSLEGLFPVTLLSDVSLVGLSIIYEERSFLLTDGQAVYREVGEEQVAQFIDFIVDCDISSPTDGGFNNLNFLSPSSQPYPVPRKPRDLQVLFGSNTATLRWNKPPLMAGASLSAWQNWTYMVQWSANCSVVGNISDIVFTGAKVDGLLSMSSYTVTVWAKSLAGLSSPVSCDGTTLQPADDAPYIAAGGDSGLLKQYLDSFDIHELLASNVRDVQDIDWYNDTIYWTNSSGHISWIALDGSSPDMNPVPMAVGTISGSVAIEWLGQQLYWNCNLTRICRGSILSEKAEVFLVAKNKINSVVVDSLNATICWTTELTVQCSRLDGGRYLTYAELTVLSGRKVAGITVDVTEGYLYWLIQDGSLLRLHRANILSNRVKDKIFAEELGWSSSEVWNHQLVYYSGRLIWLDEPRTLRIQEINNKQSVHLSPSHTVTAFSLLQKSLKPLPNGFVSHPVVIPNAVQTTSIRLEGNNTHHRILWEPSNNTEFGTVYYCVMFGKPEQRLTQILSKIGVNPYCPPSNTLSEPVLEVRNFQLNTRFNLTITPYTYWGKGGSTFKVLQSPEPENQEGIHMELLISLIVVANVIVVVIVAIVIIVFRRRPQKAPVTNVQIRSQNADEELEEIRGMVGLQNACYAVSAPLGHKEVESLPVFPRDCLKLQRLLGSGAFGEVYEGITIGNPCSEVTLGRRVAVKTLRKGANDFEKMEFLKEAHLMSQFDHPNILRLLGVCLLNEPQYLILELMEGGDLRTYLRAARPTTNHGELLSLPSILGICLDVAKGCTYLEKMHFVHRDIAARNCLVSVRGYTNVSRVVKIGDFGLARDVYKNDYYRKRGEGLLPVRWMSPESLTDGVFNRHSDVWAFGVLLWEIMTLGKLPYPAYSNDEVMHYIHSGGRLLAPTGCPENLYSIMQVCWTKEPTERPSFRHLQETLRQLVDSEEHLTNNPNGLTGHVNQGYQEDEELCSGVDEDEAPGNGLTYVLSEEGLNYLMFPVNEADQLNEPTHPVNKPTDSIQT